MDKKLKIIAERIADKIINENKKRLWPLNMWNGYVVLKHASSKKITNGVINNAGKDRNNYTGNSDYGNYFWGSKIFGKDNSNIHRITYICLVPKEDIYDMMENKKNYQDVKEAAKTEKYVAVNWPATKGAVVVFSYCSTPISFIEYSPEVNYGTEISGIYDSNWNLLRSNMLTSDLKKLKFIIKSLKRTKDIEMPDFIDVTHSYDYESAMDYWNSPEIKFKRNFR